MTEIPPPPPYDLEVALNIVNTNNLLFIGAKSADMLADFINKVPSDISSPEDVVKVEVVMFPCIVDNEGNAHIAAGPRRGYFSGKVASVLLNEKQTKGRVTFTDGTILYRDITFLE